MRTGSKESWFTVLASMATGILVIVAMIFWGLKLLL